MVRHISYIVRANIEPVICARNIYYDIVRVKSVLLFGISVVSLKHFAEVTLIADEFVKKKKEKEKT